MKLWLLFLEIHRTLKLIYLLVWLFRFYRSPPNSLYKSSTKEGFWFLVPPRLFENWTLKFLFYYFLFVIFRFLCSLCQRKLINKQRSPFFGGIKEGAVNLVIFLVVLLLPKMAGSVLQRIMIITERGEFFVTFISAEFSLFQSPQGLSLFFLFPSLKVLFEDT